MKVEKELEGLFQKVLANDVVHVKTDGMDISVSMQDGSKLSLCTTVYFGSNFIPKAVRSCLTQKKPLEEYGLVNAYLSLDEDRFRVNLNYQCDLYAAQEKSFKTLLEHFSFQAEQWRRRLDEHDRNDLIHVRVK